MNRLVSSVASARRATAGSWDSLARSGSSSSTLHSSSSSSGAESFVDARAHGISLVGTGASKTRSGSVTTRAVARSPISRTVSSRSVSTWP